MSNTWTQQLPLLYLCPTLCLFPSAHKPVPPSHAYKYNKGVNKKMQNLPFTHAPLSNKVYQTCSALRVTWALVYDSQALSPRYGLGRRETRCGNRCDWASLGNTPLQFSLLCLQMLSTQAVITACFLTSHAHSSTSQCPHPNTLHSSGHFAMRQRSQVELQVSGFPNLMGPR